MKKRQLSQGFITDLLPGGCLNPLLKEVQEDDTLCLELRGNFGDSCRGEAVNIYYRGGSLYKIVKDTNKYVITCEKANSWCESYRVKLPIDLISVSNAVDKIAFFKDAIDKSGKITLEKEFQQLIERVNNGVVKNSKKSFEKIKKISNSTDYYIVDTEYVGNNEESGFRFDMVGLKWKSNNMIRRKLKNATLALMEVKYGDGALNGSSGIKKHLMDFEMFLNNQSLLREFYLDVLEVFKQKCELGLITGLEEYQWNQNDKVDAIDTEILFVFANHNPNSKILMNELNSKDVQNVLQRINKIAPNSVKVAIASVMGYGLYIDKIIDVNSFIKELN